MEKTVWHCIHVIMASIIFVLMPTIAVLMVIT